MRNTADVTGGKPIAVLLQPISGVSAMNPLVAFYDIHGGKREVQLFYFVPDTTRDMLSWHALKHLLKPSNILVAFYRTHGSDSCILLVHTKTVVGCSIGLLQIFQFC
jgi:hypothetical protein